MAGKHRSVSRSTRRPAARILGALVAGASVALTAVAVQSSPPLPATGAGDANGHGGDALAGSLPGGTDARTSPEPATAPQGSSLSAGGGMQPVSASQSDWTRPGGRQPGETRSDWVQPAGTQPDGVAPGRSPVAGAPEVAADPTFRSTDPTPQQMPGTAPDWDTALQGALAQEASARTTAAAPTPTSSVPQPPSPASPPVADGPDRADQSDDGGVVRKLLGHLGVGR